MNDTFKEGYDAYYNGIEDCPYSYDTEKEFWDKWCDGHMFAYAEDEGK